MAITDWPCRSWKSFAAAFSIARRWFIWLYHRIRVPYSAIFADIVNAKTTSLKTKTARQSQPLSSRFAIDQKTTSRLFPQFYKRWLVDTFQSTKALWLAFVPHFADLSTSQPQQKRVYIVKRTISDRFSFPYCVMQWFQLDTHHIRWQTRAATKTIQSFSRVIFRIFFSFTE